MSLNSVKRTYEALGRDDPLYAVLSRKKLRHNKWDPVEFFQTGRREIQEILRYVGRLGLSLERGQALDFGCGVGRLSQALAEHFERVVGVDIAESMVERAREFNQHGDRVQYQVNTTDDLKIFDGGTFDFVYSNITLQHIPPEPAARYIREFFRVLRPGGVTIFQVPSGRHFEAGSLRARAYSIRRHHLRRIWKIVRGKPPVEMHYIATGHVKRIIEESRGELVDVVDVDKRRKRRRNFRFCATRSGVSAREQRGDM